LVSVFAGALSVLAGALSVLLSVLLSVFAGALSVFAGAGAGAVEYLDSVKPTSTFLIGGNDRCPIFGGIL